MELQNIKYIILNGLNNTTRGPAISRVSHTAAVWWLILGIDIMEGLRKFPGLRVSE
jgi:hypothetical protein